MTWGILGQILLALGVGGAQLALLENPHVKEFHVVLLDELS